MRRAKKICLVLILLLLAFKLAGCNTVAGLGKDIEAGGHAIKEAAE